jgi:hypothetical protein
VVVHHAGDDRDPEGCHVVFDHVTVARLVLYHPSVHPGAVLDRIHHVGRRSEEEEGHHHSHVVVVDPGTIVQRHRVEVVVDHHHHHHPCQRTAILERRAVTFHRVLRLHRLVSSMPGRSIFLVLYHSLPCDLILYNKRARNTHTQSNY